MTKYRLWTAAAVILTGQAVAQIDYQNIIHEGLTPEAKQNREVWLKEIDGENLALGKEVVFSIIPNYRLTRDDNDAFDLTDGKLTSRKDDRMWFRRGAVGWMNTPANLMIDLGAVQPIGKVAIRFLGGAEQNGLRFPRQVELVVSEDGVTFYSAASLSKLMLGEKDRAGEPGVFFLPEEGKAYAYPLVFPSLRAKARFVGVRILADLGFVFADELAVLKGDLTAEDIAYRAENRTPFVIRGLVFAPYKPMLAISTNIHTPNYFRLTDARKAADTKGPVTFVMEVPEAVTISTEQTKAIVGGEPISKQGRPFRRYTIQKPPRRRGKVGPFYLEVTDAEAVRGAKATFYATSEGYEDNPIDVPIRPVEIPRVPKLSDLHISLAWMGIAHGLRWPNFFDEWEHLGFNCVATFPRYWKGKVSPENADFLAEARRRGMRVIYNESPFHVMEHRHKKMSEIYSQIPGKESKNLCPAYRGPAYQSEIKRVGDMIELTKPDYVFYDIECWYPGGKDAPRCTRCKAKRAECGKELDDFLTDLGTEMIRDMGAEIEKRAAQLGIPVPHIATYNNHLARPVYHTVFDFRKLYPTYLKSAQPSLYVKGNAVLVHNTIRDNYRQLGNRDIIPWLSTGTYGEHEPYKVEAMILESLLNGACGITYYCFRDFDTPMDFYYHAKALAHIAPYEQLLVEGRPVDLNTDNDALFFSGYRHENEMLILVGNYQNTPRTQATIALPFEKVEQVTEVRQSKALPAARELRLDVPAQEITLMHIKAGG